MGRLRYIENSRTGEPGTLVETTTPLQFYDDDSYIYCASAGALSIIGGSSIALTATSITITGAITIDGDVTFSGDDSIAVTITDPTAAVNAIYGLINAGEDWTTGSLAAIRGKAVSTTTTLTSGNMYGGWFGMMLDTGFTGAGLGLTCGIYANVDTANTVSTVPSAVAYFEIASGTGADYANMPILVLADGSTSQSNYAFSLGFAPAGNTVSASNSSDILYQQTIHIMANGSDAYIPYSTVAGTFTSAYQIVLAATTTAVTAYTGIHNTVTCGVAHTGNVAGIRSYVTTDDGGDTLANIFAIQCKASLIGDNDKVSGMMTGLLCQIDLGTSIQGSSWGLCIDHNITGARNHAPIAFMRLVDRDYTTAPTLYLFDLGGTANAFPTGTSGDIHYQDTLHLRINSADAWIPLSTAEGNFTTAYPIYSVSAATNNIGISGTNTIGINMTGTYSTAGISIATTFANFADYAIYIAATTASTGGTNNPLYVSSIPSAAGVVARAAEFLLAPTAKMGGWGSAVKGYLNLTGASGSSGLLAGVCAEVLLPDETLKGSIGILELELVCPASGLAYGTPGIDRLAFIIMNATGTDRTVYDDSGSLIAISGLTDETGHIWFDNTLKISIDNSAWYIPLSSAQASYTTAYPIVSTYSGGASISVTCSATTNTGYYGVYANDSFTLTTSGVHKAILGKTTYTPASTGFATSIGVVGQVVLTAGKEFTGGQGAMYGVQGQLDLPNTCDIDNTSSVFAALRGVITGAPTCTNFTVLAGLYVDNLCTGDLTGGEFGASLAALTNHGAAMDNAIMVYCANAGNTLTNLLSIQGDSQSIVSSGAQGETNGAKLKVLWGSTTYYINMYR